MLSEEVDREHLNLRIARFRSLFNQRRRGRVLMPFANGSATKIRVWKRASTLSRRYGERRRNATNSYTISLKLHDAKLGGREYFKLDPARMPYAAGA
jgi:hypothetical protein